MGLWRVRFEDVMLTNPPLAEQLHTLVLDARARGIRP
jgi:hypothetical protein